MTKTTIYLPEQLKQAVAASARRRGISEAEVIREAVAVAVATDEISQRGALFSSDILLADDVDAHLVGFGER